MIGRRQVLHLLTAAIGTKPRLSMSARMSAIEG